MTDSHIMQQASILAFKGVLPTLAPGVFIADGARIIGDTHIGEDSSIWFNTVVRGDVHYIRIGKRTNIQDNSMVHVTSGEAPCIIGNDVTVGHNAVLHACTVEDACLIGMGAIILDKARIGHGSVVGAGALVTQGKEFPPRSMIIGSPAKAVRTLSEDEYNWLFISAKNYVQTARAYR